MVEPPLQAAWAKRVTRSTALIALINFFVFALISSYIGGDAINGHIANGHFFVCGHGFCTRVSAHVWHYSYYHALATIALTLLVVAEMVYFWWTGDMNSSS